MEEKQDPFFKKEKKCPNCKNAGARVIAIQKNDKKQSYLLKCPKCFVEWQE